MYTPGFFANGKPLIYDGGEAGETWRHSTLSFYANHTMLAPGHVERFFDSDSLGFTQGVSMSGNLRDPGKSLPRGTFAAVGVSILVYFGAAVVLAGSILLQRLEPADEGHHLMKGR